MVSGFTKDTIRLRLDGLLGHLSSCPWSPRADMKDEMVPAALST